MIAKAAKPSDLIFPNTIGGVEGHFLRKFQAIAERAWVTEPELHRFRKSYADTLADLRRTCARLCHLAGGELEQIQFLLGHSSVQTTEHYLGCKQKLNQAVNDNLGLEDT